jgi:hypothetical protein
MLSNDGTANSFVDAALTIDIAKSIELPHTHTSCTLVQVCSAVLNTNAPLSGNSDFARETNEKEVSVVISFFFFFVNNRSAHTFQIVVDNRHSIQSNVGEFIAKHCRSFNAGIGSLEQ